MPLGQKVVTGHVVSDFFFLKFAYEFKIYSYFVVCREDKKLSRAQLYKRHLENIARYTRTQMLYK